MTFELDRFAWTPDALEVSGRWVADAPRRFRHVRLVVEQDGRRRRLAPAKATPLRATPNGEPWAATFPWESEEPPERPLLEAGHDLLVELPAPDRVEVIAGHLPGPGDGRLEAEIAALRAERAAEREAALAIKRELAAEREALAAERTAFEAERTAFEAERTAFEAERAAFEAERAAFEAERAAFEAERTAFEAGRTAFEAERTSGGQTAGEESTTPIAIATRGQTPEGVRERWVDPERHAAIQHALERPRQPDDPVRGPAPLAVRVIAVALSASVVVGLGMMLGAIL